MAARVRFRQGETCSCVAESLPWVELDMIRRGIIHSEMDIAQLGWRTSVAASAGTHAEGGCTDGWGQWDEESIDIQRLWGWTSQRRDLTGVGTHWHGWPWGCTHLSPAAQNQADDWARRRNGLANNGPVVGRWPVPTWTEAIRERKGALLKDIADAVADELVRRRAELAAPQTNANAVLNAKIGTGAMKGWTVEHVLDWTARATGSQGDTLADVQRKIAALPAAATIAGAVEAAEAAEEKALETRLAAFDRKLDALAAAVAALPKPAPPTG